MRRWLGEPLVHFLAIGSLLFGVYAVAPPRRLAPVRTIAPARSASPPRRFPTSHRRGSVCSSASLRARSCTPWSRDTSKRSCSAAKRGNWASTRTTRSSAAVSRRRSNSWSATRPASPSRRTRTCAPPTKRTGQSFRTPARISFVQVFFNPQTRRDTDGDARAALAALSIGAPIASFGDPSPIDAEVRDEISQNVAGQFGDEFAKAVFALKPGAWQGPFVSSFGLHLVRVTEAKPARQLAFSEVEPQVRERWRDEHQRAANEQHYEDLMNKYGVVVDESVKPLIGSLDGFAALASRTVTAAAGSDAGAGSGAGIAMKVRLSLSLHVDARRAGGSGWLSLGLRRRNPSRLPRTDGRKAGRVRRIVENTHARRRALAGRTRILRRRQSRDASHDPHPARRSHRAMDLARAGAARTDAQNRRPGRFEDGRSRPYRIRRRDEVGAAADGAGNVGQHPDAAKRLVGLGRLSQARRRPHPLRRRSRAVRPRVALDRQRSLDAP